MQETKNQGRSIATSATAVHAETKGAQSVMSGNPHAPTVSDITASVIIFIHKVARIRGQTQKMTRQVHRTLEMASLSYHHLRRILPLRNAHIERGVKSLLVSNLRVLVLNRLKPSLLWQTNHSSSLQQISHYSTIL